MKIAPCLLFISALIYCSSSLAMVRPPWLNHCLQLKNVSDTIQSEYVMGSRPIQAYKAAIQTNDPFGKWQMPHDRIKKLVNLIYFKPQLQAAAELDSDPIGQSLRDSCIHHHENSVRGIHPLK